MKVPKYIDPLTDFGFKKLFGEEASKDLLIAFLNAILPEIHQIEELTFINTEILPDNKENRKSVFDIHCQSKTGERFIVEMQKARIKFFKDRSLFYVSHAITKQAQTGDWDFQLEPIYLIAIDNFKFDTPGAGIRYKTDVALKDENGAVFYDKLHFCFIELPFFNKKDNELETHSDKWLFFLKNLEDFDKLPMALNEPIFKKGLEIASVANLNGRELEVYNQNKKEYLDMMNVIETAREEGIEEGIEKGIKKGIKKGIEKGIEKGREKERDGILINLLKNTSLSIEDIAKNLNISVDYAKEIAKEIRTQK